MSLTTVWEIYRISDGSRVELCTTEAEARAWPGTDAAKLYSVRRLRLPVVFLVFMVGDHNDRGDTLIAITTTYDKALEHAKWEAMGEYDETRICIMELL